ncbi:DUF4129 domain-containing protein [Xylanimonas sp. McL0601]|uniref:DUF4129 domain-containing protein n=1 Tax=Xylanimonas sp. McL0601 TaxID=3414739 RepID=UPI003CE6DA09
MRSRAVPAIGAVVLLALVVVAAAAGSPWRFDLPGVQIAPGPAPTFASQPSAPSLPPIEAAPGPDLTPWFVGAFVLVALVVAFFLGRLVLRQIAEWREREKPPDVGLDLLGGASVPGGQVDLPALVDAVSAALARLDTAGTPHDAVVAAWVELENAAARHGWERFPSETSTEFTTRLLGVSAAPPEHTAVLRRLYQQARFTQHHVTEAQVAQARSALEAIARALEGKAP